MIVQIYQRLWKNNIQTITIKLQSYQREEIKKKIEEDYRNSHLVAELDWEEYDKFVLKNKSHELKSEINSNLTSQIAAKLEQMDIRDD